MSFTATAWQAAAPIVGAIEQHPFIAGLADGTLAMERFRHYMAQDACYLAAYARVLALAASQAPHADEVEFWAGSAVRAISVERELHAQFIADTAGIGVSPTCAAYTGGLAALATQGCYPALVAGLLPCFRIYQHVGERLAPHASATHPYRLWIAAYADPAFATASRRAGELADRAVAAGGPALAARAQAAFLTACRHEWMFWDAAWRLETWPL
ncbi:MAG: thiaminase II [Rhodanobacter sp.]|nr:MAG: thiaminase II [Rhodanobacter sp.]TAM08868.1 MAG: thiaminase II [Rhodanobacter sp.]TAM36910.1 MAG: thiaminase II [Rhodanobacter sp.]